MDVGSLAQEDWLAACNNALESAIWLAALASGKDTSTIKETYVNWCADGKLAEMATENAEDSEEDVHEEAVEKDDDVQAFRLLAHDMCIFTLDMDSLECFLFVFDCFIPFVQRNKEEQENIESVDTL